MSFSELSVQHSRGSMRTLQRRLLWKRGSEDMQSLPVPIQRAHKQVGEKKTEHFQTAVLIIKLNCVFQELKHDLSINLQFCSRLQRGLRRLPVYMQSRLHWRQVWEVSVRMDGVCLTGQVILLKSCADTRLRLISVLPLILSYLFLPLIDVLLVTMVIHWRQEEVVCPVIATAMVTTVIPGLEVRFWIPILKQCIHPLFNS